MPRFSYTIPRENKNKQIYIYLLFLMDNQVSIEFIDSTGLNYILFAHNILVILVPQSHNIMRKYNIF